MTDKRCEFILKTISLSVQSHLNGTVLHEMESSRDVLTFLDDVRSALVISNVGSLFSLSLFSLSLFISALIDKISSD
jgi:hypothetical protein